MKRNKFSKALKHLKSKKRLDETAPTNSMSGVYQVSPSTGDAFRLGVDPPKEILSKGRWYMASGIPGDAVIYIMIVLQVIGEVVEIHNQK